MILTVTPNPAIDAWFEVVDLREGAFHRIAQTSFSAGGKGINVSRAMHALGGSVLALTVAGGTTGKQFKQLLKKESVPFRVVPCQDKTRINYKIVSRKTRRTTELNTAGPHLSEQTLRELSQAITRLLPRVSCMVFSGSTPPGVAATYYRDWILRCRRERVPVVADASGQLLSLCLTAKPWLIKPNREEAEALLGISIRSLRRAKQAVRKLCMRGAEMAVLSLGKEGALWTAQKTSQIWKATPPQLEVKSTVGSGDALLAGLLHAWADGSTWPEALQYGVSCGSATAQKSSGTFCTAREARRVFSKVRLKRLT